MRCSMVTIPLNLEHTAIFIYVIFSGNADKKTLKMIFDTGATITSIPTQTAIAIGCDPVKSSRRTEILTASGTEYVPIVTIPRIKLMGFTLENVDAICHDLPPRSGGSGLLGLNVLKNFDIRLSFLKKSLELTK